MNDAGEAPTCQDARMRSSGSGPAGDDGGNRQTPVDPMAGTTIHHAAAWKIETAVG